MFRFKAGVKVPYDRQGYIYFLSRIYRELDAERQRSVWDLCRKCGGEYGEALFEFVTTDRTATEITEKYYLSRATLYRAVKKYYEDFEI